MANETTIATAIAAVEREAHRHSFGPDRDTKQQQALLSAIALLKEVPHAA